MCLGSLELWDYCQNRCCCFSRINRTIWIINTVLAFVMLNKTNQQSDPRDTSGINSLKESANLSSQFSKGLHLIPLTIQWASTEFLFKRTSASHDKKKHLKLHLGIYRRQRSRWLILNSQWREKESLVWLYIVSKDVINHRKNFR